MILANGSHLEAILVKNKCAGRNAQPLDGIIE